METWKTNVILAGLALGMLGTGRSLAATYYVDSVAGNDANIGTATNAAWQSAAKINATTFHPGDFLLLKCGGAWTNTVNPKGAGTNGSPIVLGAYGSGAAPLINGNGDTDALVLTNQAYWEIQNLAVINPGPGTTTERRGIHLCAANFGTVNHLYVSNCLVANVCGRVDGTNHAGDDSDLVAKRTGGIVVEVIDDSSVATRFNDVRILGCTIMAVTNQGIVACANRTSPGDYPGTAAWNSEYCSNLLISDNVIDNVCKNAMSIRYADESGVVGHNTVYNTANTSDGNQICSYSCRGTVFQYNEGYLNNGDGAADGSLYDADLRSPRTVWQYSYSHDNSWGLFTHYASADTNGNDTGIVVRYNISQNDRGDVFTFAGEAGGLAAATLYNNTVYSTNGSVTLFSDQENGTHTNFVYNNIFATVAGVTNLYTFHSYNFYTFSNNVYYGSHPGDEPADAGKLTNNPEFVAPGTGGGIGGTDNLATLTGYQLQSGSPCLNSGLTVTTNLAANTNLAAVDFFGVTVPSGGGISRGASQWVAADLVPTLTSLAATVLPNSAELTVQVNPGGAATGGYFLYGTTTNYGNATATNPVPAGTNVLAMTNLVTGLLAGTLYHYRACATNSAGGTNTADATFTTTAVSVPRLLGAAGSSAGNFQLAFTNTPGASFTVVATTNLTAARANWLTLGTATEVSPGQYQFTDPWTNRPTRFYQIHCP